MHTTIMILVATLRETFLSRASLHLENLALRQQVAILKRERRRPRLQMLDRLFWVILSRLRPQRRAASIGGFDRGGALFEHIDLVDQLRFRLAKAPLPDCGWTGHVPLLANRLFLGGILRMRTLPHCGETSQFVRGWRAVIRAAKAILLERLNVGFGCVPW